MENNDLLSAIFDSSFAGFALISKDGLFIDSNERFCAILGLSKSALLRLSYSDILYNDGGIDLEYELRNSPSGEKKFITKYYSKFIWGRYTLSKVVENENSFYYVLMVESIEKEIDIHNKLKDTEYRLKEAEVITNLGHWDWNILEDSLYWSDMMMEIFGKTKKDFSADYNSFIETVHPEDRENVNITVQKTLENNIPFNMEYKIIVNDDIKIIHARGKIIYIDNVATRMFGTCQDVTGIKQLQLKEKQQEHLLMQQSKLAAMGEMLSAIAHQWRQPLNAIALSTQDFIYLCKYEKTYDDESFSKFKKEIMEQLHYMSNTIDEFRNFFKHNSSSEQFNIIDLINSVASLYSSQLKANDISLKMQVAFNETTISLDNVDYSIKEEFYLKNNASELKQVLINCIANAKDAIVEINDKSEYEKEIVMTAKKEGDFMCISISDLAGGIKEENINKIFEPYFTSKELGTGLGLYICKKIVEKSLRGNISYINRKEEIKSNNYEGSTFLIKIPVT